MPAKMLVTLIALLPLLNVNAGHGNGEPVFTINGGELTAVELNGATDVSIPYGVTRIRNDAFRYCNGLKSVTIGFFFISS